MSLRLSTDSFRLCDLPVEVQQQIWDYCLDLTAVFHHTTPVDADPTYTLPSMQGGKRPLLGIEDEDDDADDDLPHSLDDFQDNDPNNVPFGGYDEYLAVLALKVNVSIPLPLLLTSKATTEALQNVLRLSKPRTIEDYINTFQSSVDYHRLTSKTPDFLHLWSHADLVLSDEIHASIFLLS